MTPSTPAIELEELFRPIQAGQGNQTRNDSQEDAEKDMWATYMNEVKEDDIRDAAAWRQDADGILVFTGLFAATVGAFIIEFYKKLSPDSGDQTVDLLKQISRQLAGSSNGTDINTENQSPSSETLIIWVMGMWLTSLVLSITSALVATLLQQWARRYIEMPKIPSQAFHRARVRSFMFYGTQLYKMSVAVQIPSALLHLSVFFFFGGLVALFHSIDKRVAIAIYVSVGLFVVAYITLTILPCIDHRCPYRTPMSYILWYLWHTLLSLVAFSGHFLIGQVDDLMVTPTSDDGSSSTLSWLVQYFEEDVKKHKQRLKNGFVKSIIQKAIQSPIDLDRMALTWLFKILALADKSKLSKFVASIPRDKVIELFTPPFDSGKIIFREPFLKLLQSCAAGPRAVETISVNIQSQPQIPGSKSPPPEMYVPAVLFFKENGDLDEEAIKSHMLRLAQVSKLEEDALKRCRLSYLHVIHHIVKAFIVTGFDEAWTLALLDDIRVNFANISFMREMWSDNDIVIRITSRSICALLAKRLLQKARLGETELRWLHEVTGERANMILNAPDVAMVLEKNRKVFVSRVLEYDLPNEHAAFFTETLAILFDAGVQNPFDRAKFRNSLPALICSVEAEDGNTEVANKLRQIFHDILGPSTPSASAPPTSVPPGTPGPLVSTSSALPAPALPTPAPSPSPMPTTTPPLAPPTFPQAPVPAPAPAFPTPTSVQP